MPCCMLLTRVSTRVNWTRSQLDTCVEFVMCWLLSWLNPHSNSECLWSRDVNPCPDIWLLGINRLWNTTFSFLNLNCHFADTKLQHPLDATVVHWVAQSLHRPHRPSQSWFRVNSTRGQLYTCRVDRVSSWLHWTRHTVNSTRVNSCEKSKLQHKKEEHYINYLLRIYGHAVQSRWNT